MAAPTYASAGTGMYHSGTGTMYYTSFSATVGQLVLFQILTDSGNVVTYAIAGTSTGIDALDGTDSSMTQVGTYFSLGTGGRQHIWLGRATDTIVEIDVTVGAYNESAYVRAYLFDNASTGTTLATVIENGSAGATTTSSGTSTSVTDAAVTTLGADRLAVNLIGVNDDNALGNFAGETGGDWTLRADYGSSTGTDGEIGIQTAAMASAGTIDGGSYTMGASDGWGVVGFALIGTTLPKHLELGMFVNMPPMLPPQRDNY